MAKMKINFEGVPKEIRRGGSGTHLPEGDYLLKVVNHSVEKSEKSGAKYIRWQFQVAAGEFKGKTVYTNTSLKPEALWNLRNLIYAALQKNVAGKALNFDPDQLHGKVIAGTATDNAYKDKEGKERMSTNIEDMRPKDELSGDEEDEEEEGDEEEEETEEDDEELEDVDIEDI